MYIYTGILSVQARPTNRGELVGVMTSTTVRAFYAPRVRKTELVSSVGERDITI